MQDSYPMPKDGWVCFHCGERFTTVGGAEDHFGSRPADMAACRIKIGEERGLVMELRSVQAELRRLKDIGHGIYAAVHWNHPEDGECPAPEVLLTIAENDMEARARFNRYIQDHGLGWQTYSLEIYINHTVAHMVFDDGGDDSEGRY